MSRGAADAFPAAAAAAFAPATRPCAAASSYPVVPLICPLKNRPAIFFVSRLESHWYAGKKSYSTAYAGRSIFTFSNPGSVRSSASCSLSGKPVLKPCTYTSGHVRPSGSKKIWCDSLSAKRTILSSMLGQYRGPFAPTHPP